MGKMELVIASLCSLFVFSPCWIYLLMYFFSSRFRKYVNEMNGIG